MIQRLVAVIPGCSSPTVPPIPESQIWHQNWTRNHWAKPEKEKNNKMAIMDNGSDIVQQNNPKTNNPKPNNTRVHLIFAKPAYRPVLSALKQNSVPGLPHCSYKHYWRYEWMAVPVNQCMHGQEYVICVEESKIQV